MSEKNIYSLSRLDYASLKGLGNIDWDSDCIFDLSQLSFATPDGIVLFRLLLYKMCNEKGKRVKVIFPKEDKGEYSVRRYLTHVNLFNGLKIELELKDQLYHLTGKYLLPKESNSPTHTKIIDGRDFDLASKIADLVTVLTNFLGGHGFIKQAEKYLYRNIFHEAFLNHKNHSRLAGTPSYFCAQAQVYKKNKPKIILCIGDCGVGVKASLNTQFNYPTDEDALNAAVVEQKSRFVGNEDRGGGIRYIFDKCGPLKLNCLLRSGKSQIQRLKGHHDFEFSNTPSFPGTQLILWS